MTLPITQLTNADLTTGTISGTGVFDVIANSLYQHLNGEYSKNRITGAEYTKAYIALMDSALQQSIAYLLNRDKQYWELLALEAQVKLTNQQTANVLAESLNIPKQGLLLDQQRINLVSEELRINAQTSQTIQQTTNLLAESANIPKQGLAIDAQTDQVIKQTQILDKEVLIKAEQILIAKEEVLLAKEKIELAVAEQNIAIAKLANIPKEGVVLDQQALQATAQTNNIVGKTAQDAYMLANILPTQNNLTKEQFEAARAQTTNTRSDGTTAIAGTIGAQKALYDQQKESYVQKVRLDTAQIFSNAFSIRKTVDDVASTPDQFEDPAINAVMTALRTGVGM